MPAANRSGVGAKRDAGWLAVIMVYVLRTDGALTLAPAAVTTLKALAADSKMAKLWKVISPGKKKPAASGTAGSSSGASEPPIDDALRQAVAAAAARAQVKADAWLAAHRSL